MPVPPKPRIPGSQVAPGQRPLFRDEQTASTHSKIPIAQATAGRTFRVRCKDWAAVHGEGLSWDDANKLKNQRAAEGFRTVRVEDEEIPPPPGYVAETAQGYLDEQPYVDGGAGIELGVAGPAAAVDPELEGLRAAAFTAARQAAAAANGRVTDNGAAARAEQLARMTGSRPVVRAITEEAPRAAAPPPVPSKFVAPAAPKRAAAPVNPNRVIPRDKTVQGEVFRRSSPAPRDRTAASEVLKRSHAPASAEPRPLISPLKAAMMADDPLDIPDSAVVGDDDLSDLMSDLGGGASDKDVERAKAQAAAEQGGIRG